MRIERILHKMQLQAEAERREQRRQEREKAAYPVVTQKTRIDQGIDLICNLEQETKDIRLELAVRQGLKRASDQYAKAALALREANLTWEEKQARDSEIRRGQILFSRIVPENSPTWREDATAAFRNKKL